MVMCKKKKVRKDNKECLCVSVRRESLHEYSIEHIPYPFASINIQYSAFPAHRHHRRLMMRSFHISSTVVCCR